jgi:endogenous inhibitor of DNA gyrase (YacG/DUF329 family)
MTVQVTPPRMARAESSRSARSSRPTRFRASCPECRGITELGADAFRLAVGRTRERTFYSFTCPECGAAVRKPAGERIVVALTSAGVRTMRLLAAAGT